MADYAVMPYTDYEDACDAVREKTGGTEAIVSGDLGAKIRSITTGGTQETPEISVSSTGLITATSGDLSATKQLTTQAAKTITPGTSSQTAVEKGRYTTGAVTVAGDADLVPENILSGVDIFGVTGTAKNCAVGTVTQTYSSLNLVFPQTLSWRPTGCIAIRKDLYASGSTSVQLLVWLVEDFTFTYGSSTFSGCGFSYNGPSGEWWSLDGESPYASYSTSGIYTLTSEGLTFNAGTWLMIVWA